MDIAREFISHVSNEANKVCLKEGKKTISTEFLLEALKNLGFTEYVKDMEEAGEKYLKETNEKGKIRQKQGNFDNIDELEAEQKRLFEVSRQSNQEDDEEDYEDF